MPRYDDILARVKIGTKPRTLDDVLNLEEDERRGSSYPARYDPSKGVGLSTAQTPEN